MNKETAIKKYGKSMLKKMEKTGWLDGITVSINKDGTINVPESDYDRAYRAAMGEEIHPLEWD